MECTKREWKVANSGGSVIKGGIGHPTTIAVLETAPFKITPEVQANARLIAAAPELARALTRIGIEGKREAGNYDKYDARGFVRIAEDALALLKEKS